MNSFATITVHLARERLRRAGWGCGSGDTLANYYKAPLECQHRVQSLRHSEPEQCEGEGLSQRERFSFSVIEGAG